MLEVRAVSKTFNAGTPNEVRSLRGVNLDLEPLVPGSSSSEPTARANPRC